MKTEVNLRPVDFVRNREFYWPRVLLTIFPLLLIVLVGMAGFYLHLELDKLTAERDMLQREVTQKEETAAALKALQAETKAVADKEALIAALKEQQQPWSVYLQLLFDNLPAGVELTNLAPGSAGEVSISGSGPDLETVDLYRQRLLKMSFITGAEVDFFNIVSGNPVYFQATFKMEAGEGDEQTQQ